MKRDRTIKKRHQLARQVERAAVPERPFVGRGLRYLVHPRTTAACAPSFQAIAAALRDDACVIGDESLAEVRTFITDGGSTFFGRDETAALRDAVRLQHTVVGADTAVPAEEYVAIAV